MFDVPEEKKEAEKKFLRHKCEFKKRPGAIGGRITYKFTPTSLGVICIIECACGKTVSLTDYDNW